MIFSGSPLPAVYLAVPAAIFSYLYWNFRRDNDLLWGAGWTLLLVRQIASGEPAFREGFWAWADAGLVMAAVVLVAAGGAAFAGRRRLSPLGGLAFGFALGALTVLLFLAAEVTHPAPSRPWAAAASFLAAGGIGTGWLIDRYGRATAPTGSRLAGFALALWGVAQTAEWILSARGLGSAWIPPVDAALGTALAIGMVILGFEEARARISAGQASVREILDDDPNLVVVLQSDRPVYANRAIEERLGLSLEEVRRTGIFEHIAPEQRDQAAERLGERVQGRSVADYELEILAADGSRVPVRVHANPIEWDGAPALKYELTDLSTRKRAEEEVRAINAELQRINAELEKSNELKSEFLSNTGHELKTPLTSIIANTEILEYEMCGPVNEEQRQVLGNIGRNSQYLLEMISRLLDFVRYGEEGDVVRYGRVDPRTLIDGVVRTLSPLIEGRPLSIEVDVEEGLEPCWLDGEKVYRIWLNLAENAIKFSERGKIWIGARSVDGELEGSVTDEGIGIPPDRLVDIFDAFRQADASPTRPYQGVGLGLAISKQLVELHHGRIWAESEPGRGSRFVFRIPYRTEPPEPEAASGAAPEA